MYLELGGNKLITDTLQKIQITKNNTRNRNSEIENSMLPDFHWETLDTFKQEIISILRKRPEKTEEEGTIPSSFRKTHITLMPKPDKDTRKLETDPLYEHRI